MLNVTANNLRKITLILQECAAQIREVAGVRVELVITEITAPEPRDLVLEAKEVESLLCHVASSFRMTVNDIKSRSRKGLIPRARFMFWKMAKERFPHRSLKTLGHDVGHYDHSSVIHGITTIEDLMSTDPLIREQYENLKIQTA